MEVQCTAIVPSLQADVPHQQASATGPPQQHRSEEANGARKLPGGRSRVDASAVGDIVQQAVADQHSSHAYNAEAPVVPAVPAATKPPLAQGKGGPSESSAGPEVQQAADQGASVETEAQIAPWTDGDGVLNELYWRTLTQRAMSAVMRLPGSSSECKHLLPCNVADPTERSSICHTGILLQ